jgi:hypothetical protein
MVTALQSAFAGKKTYLIAGASIIYIVLGYLLGKTPDLDYKTLTELVLAMTIRAGISKGAV